MSATSSNSEPSEAPRLSDLTLVLDALARIEAALSKPRPTLILKFSEVPAYYPNITEREIRAACGKPRGPRKFKPGHVSDREIEAWIKREEEQRGVRTT